MKSKKIWANMAVKDVQRTTKFYTELGFKLNGSPTEDLVSFLAGDDKFIMHFFASTKLQTAMKGELADLSKGNEIIFTLSSDSKEEVNQWAKEIREAGGNLISQPEEFGAGYYGFVFSDPDGHRFNVFYM
jgi:predicted lactoylglutathione lyase